MQDKLLGYVLGCLDGEEVLSVERACACDKELARQLDILRFALDPLRHAPPPVDPPDGLATRTCQQIRALGDAPGKESGQARDAQVPSDRAAPH